MPSLEDLKESRDAFLVLDDLMLTNSKFLSKIYSVYSHHFHFSVPMTVQNLFHKGLREISLNADAFLVLDDLMLTNSEFLSKIYSVYSHHFHFSVPMTVQNLFHKGLREISLNAQIMVLFKSCRDVNQIAQFYDRSTPKSIKTHWRHIKTLYLSNEVNW